MVLTVVRRLRQLPVGGQELEHSMTEHVCLSPWCREKVQEIRECGVLLLELCLVSETPRIHRNLFVSALCKWETTPQGFQTQRVEFGKRTLRGHCS